MVNKRIPFSLIFLEYSFWENPSMFPVQSALDKACWCTYTAVGFLKFYIVMYCIDDDSENIMTKIMTVTKLHLLRFPSPGIHVQPTIEILNMIVEDGELKLELHRVQENIYAC